MIVYVVVCSYSFSLFWIYCNIFIYPLNYYNIILVSNYILLIILLYMPKIFPLSASTQDLPLPQTMPTPLFISMGIMHISSLATPFPILYFTSPWLFCNYLFVPNTLTWLPIPLHVLPIWQSSKCSLYHDSACVHVFLVCFLDSIVDRYIFIAILLLVVLTFS